MGGGVSVWARRGAPGAAAAAAYPVFDQTLQTPSLTSSSSEAGDRRERRRGVHVRGLEEEEAAAALMFCLSEVGQPKPTSCSG